MYSDCTTKENLGEWLRDKRISVGLTQQELSDIARLGDKSFVCHIEKGRQAIPPDKYIAYAHALQVPVKEFIAKVMECYEPENYKVIFKGE